MSILEDSNTTTSSTTSSSPSTTTPTISTTMEEQQQPQEEEGCCCCVVVDNDVVVDDDVHSEPLSPSHENTTTATTTIIDNGQFCIDSPQSSPISSSLNEREEEAEESTSTSTSPPPPPSSSPPLSQKAQPTASPTQQQQQQQQQSSTNHVPTTTTTTTTPKSTSISSSIDMRRIPSQLRLAILSLNRDQLFWEDIEDDLYILLDGKIEKLQLFKSLYFDHELSKHNSVNTKTLLLRSLAYLCSMKANDITIHDEHVTRLSQFLIAGRTSSRTNRKLKLAALQTMMKCISPSDGEENSAMTSSSSSWQYQDDVINGTYDFLITRSIEWEYMDNHSAMALLYEIRAKCLREIDLEQERLQRLAERGDEAAILIATGAKLVEIGIQKSNKAIEGHIDNAGKKVKDWVDPDIDPLIRDRDAVVAMAFSDTAKRASEYAREGTKIAISNLRDASLSGLYMVGNKLGEGGQLTDRLSPEGREILKAAGKVGIATVGAAAMVGEAVVETSRGIVKKTAGVTADVVGHKYGMTAGEVAKNAADTAENVFLTVGNLALIEGNVLAKNVAKSVGKDQIDKDIDKVKDTIQSLEKHVSKMASQTLGIEWKGNWLKEITAGTESSENTANFVVKSKTSTPANHIIPPEKRNDCEDRVLKTELSPTGTPPKPGINKSSHHGSNEDHCSSETSSLSSSVSTEQTAYRIARRGGEALSTESNSFTTRF